jgi:hypothetical protein
VATVAAIATIVVLGKIEGRWPAVFVAIGYEAAVSILVLLFAIHRGEFDGVLWCALVIDVVAIVVTAVVACVTH